MKLRHLAAFFILFGCAGLHAADWRILMAEPPGLAQRLPYSATGIEDGVINLGAGDQLVFSSTDNDVVVLVNGPALLERASSGDLLIIRQGSVAVACDRAMDRFFEISIEDAQRTQVLHSIVPMGTTYVRVVGEQIEVAVQSAEAWTPSDLPMEPLPAGRVVALKDGTWTPTDAAPAALAQSAGLDLAAATSRFGVQSARKDQLAVQQKLVVNLLAIDQKARERAVREQIRPQSELRIVTIGASQTAVVLLSAAGTQAGLVPGQQANFLNLTFPGVGSPASLALGNQNSVDFLRRVAEGRAVVTGGQGLGTGGLFSLGVSNAGVGPGGLIGRPQGR